MMTFSVVWLSGMVLTAFLHRRACPHMYRTIFEVWFDRCVLFLIWPLIMLIICLGWIDNIVVKLIEREKKGNV